MLSLISIFLQMCRLKKLNKIIQTLIPSNPRRMWIRWACFLVWTNTMVWSRKVRQIRAANTASRSPSWPALILQKQKALYLSLLTTSKSKHTKVYRVCRWKQKLVTDSINQKDDLTICILQGSFFFLGLLATEQMTLVLQRDWWYHPCCNAQSCVKNTLCSEGLSQRKYIMLNGCIS